MSFNIWRATSRLGRNSAPTLTDAEAKQVLTTAVSPLVAVRDEEEADIVGIGQCQHPVTRQKCEYFQECMESASGYDAMSCRVRIDADAERTEREQRNAAAAKLAEQMLEVIRASALPMTFQDVVAKLKIDTQDKAAYDRARGAFHRLILEHPQRIEAVGLQRSYSGRNSRKVKTWVAVEEDHA